MLDSKASALLIESPGKNRCAQLVVGEGGFTLVELVVTMIIVGILAVIIMPRFSEQSTFDARSFADQTLAALRYAQKSAIAQRRRVCVAFSAANVQPATVTLRIEPNFTPNPADPCSSPLSGPNGATPYTITAPDGISFSTLTPNATANFFDPSGRPAFGQTIQVSGTSSSITVEPETGYVR